MRRIVVGRASVVLATAALGTVAAPAGASAACGSSWRAPVSGRWDDAANWTNGVPTTMACITVPGSYTVSVRGDEPLEAMRLGGASGRQVVDIAGTCRSEARLWLAGDDDAADSFVAAHGEIRLHDVGCDAGAELETGRRLVNSGLIDVEASNKDARRVMDGQFINRGTVRVGGAAQLTTYEGIFSARAARLQLRLTSAGLPALGSDFGARVIPRNLDVLVDPSFVPTHESWTFCNQCIRHATNLTGTTLPGGYVIVFHFQHDHQFGNSWVQATIRRA